MQLSFIRAGKPDENVYIESRNGKFRDACLNEHSIIGLAHARRIIEPWRVEYNSERPHSSFGNRTPQECATNPARKEELNVSLTVDSNSIPDQIGCHVETTTTDGTGLMSVLKGGNTSERQAT